MVGVIGFEPTTSRSRTERTTPVLHPEVQTFKLDEQMRPVPAIVAPGEDRNGADYNTLLPLIQ